MSPTQVLGNRFCKLMHMSWVLKYSKIAPWHSLLLLFSTDINSTEQLSKSHIRCGGREAGRRTQDLQIFNYFDFFYPFEILWLIIASSSVVCNIQGGNQLTLVSIVSVQYTFHFCHIDHSRPLTVLYPHVLASF